MFFNTTATFSNTSSSVTLTGITNLGAWAGRTLVRTVNDIWTDCVVITQTATQPNIEGNDFYNTSIVTTGSTTGATTGSTTGATGFASIYIVSVFLVCLLVLL